MDEWVLAEFMCHFWMFTGYWATFVSSNHLVLIAVDRYRVVFEGANYLQRRTIRSVVVEPVAYLYFIGFSILLPFLTNWESVAIYGPSPDSDKIVCHSNSNPMLVVVCALILVIFPSPILTLLYIELFLEMKQRFERRMAGDFLSQTNSNTYTALSKPVIMVDSESSETESNGKAKNKGRKPSSQYLQVTSDSKDLQRVTPEKVTRRKIRLNERKERRAAITLGILIAFFLINGPYGILRLLELFGAKADDVRRFGMALASINCGINPIIYGIRNQDFKNAIIFIRNKYLVRHQA